MRAATQPRLITLILLTGLSVLSLNMFLPSLAQMAEDLQVSYALMSLAIGAFMFFSAGLQIVMGPLSDMFGRRPVILLGMCVFALASIGCMLAQDFWVFMAFRMLQAAVIIGMVTSRAVVRDIAPPQEAARLLGVIGSAMALAPLLGPLFGGFLGEAFGWRANFAAFALMGGAVLVLCWFDLGETNQNQTRSFTAQFRAYPALVRSKLFWAYCGTLAFSLASFYAFLGGAALVGEAVFALSPAQVGLAMGSTSGGFMLGTFITGRYAGQIDPLRLVLMGRWLGTLGPLVAIGLFVAGLVSPVVLVGGAVFVGLGNGLTVPSANAGVMSVEPTLAGSAAGLSGALSVLCGAFAATLTGALVGGALGAYVLLAMMSGCAALGLVCAVWAKALERVS